MRTFTFKPKHQPFEREVSFELLPLTKSQRYDLQCAMTTNGGVPNSAAVERVLLENVAGWANAVNPDVPFSRAALRAAAIDGEATPDDAHWLIWSVEIAGELYARSVVTDAEKKT